MYRLTDIMLQNLEKDLKKFHELFQGGRVVRKGNRHDIGCDIMVNNNKSQCS